MLTVKNGWGHIIQNYAIISVGVILLALGISVFYAPYGMVTGGVSGLAIIIAETSKGLGFSIPIWLTNLLFNVPLFAIGLKALGIKNLAKTIYATFFLSFALYLTNFIPAIETDLTIASVFGGVTCGLGLGLVFRSVATTGGTDLAANIIHLKLRHVSIQKIMFVLDATIIIIGLFTFGPIKAMYAIVGVFITSKVIDGVLEGLSFAKAAFIISTKSDEISKSILLKIDRGVTALSGRGAYTNTEKDVLLCVVSSKELVEIKQLVKEIDNRAFVIVADVREVLGEGFKSM